MDYLKYNFDEFLKTLVILSLDPEEQVEAYGIGNTEEEIAIDLESYFTLQYNQYLENKL